MTKRKLGPIEDGKPVKVTLELRATLHRDLERLYLEHFNRTQMRLKCSNLLFSRTSSPVRMHTSKQDLL
ncbi:DUF2274 domain-containing protein [Acetobacter fabarum]|uniref:DUF2274 domain-containing protein n=1 Tax=Acetobacter fabarum TaxID=483199 RepID=UPI0039EA5DD9